MKMIDTGLGFGIAKKARLFWDEEEVRGKNEKSRREKP